MHIIGEERPLRVIVMTTISLSGGGLVVSDESVVTLGDIPVDTDHHGLPHHGLHLLSPLLAPGAGRAHSSSEARVITEISLGIFISLIIVTSYISSFYSVMTGGLSLIICWNFSVF